jgi:hypothetical protein
MVELKRQIDSLAGIFADALEKLEDVDTRTAENSVSIGLIEKTLKTIPNGTNPAPCKHGVEVENLEKHIPTPLLKRMVEVFEDNSHKDINAINQARVLMEMQVELGKLTVELANSDPDLHLIRDYVVDLMNYSVILWKKTGSMMLGKIPRKSPGVPFLTRDTSDSVDNTRRDTYGSQFEEDNWLD